MTNSVRRLTWLCGLVVALLSTTVLAQSTGNTFDHGTTGFDLMGSHQFVACESCHVGGQFEGTSQQCFSCHESNGRFNATPKPIDHIISTNQCENCHSATAWEDVSRVDHNEVIGECVLCHNNVVAPGKPQNHVKVGDQCDSCHWDMSWLPAGFDHSLAMGGCFDCHNNVVQDGKPADHINASNQCESCHTYAGWVPVVTVDHNEVMGSCNSCHNGVTADGKPADHVPASEQCDACHTNSLAWAPVVAVDHNELSSTNCISCHFAGNPYGADFKVDGEHIPNVSNDCEICHSAAQFPAPFAMSGMAVHSDEAMLMLDNCASCHGLGFAPGKPNDHISASNNCSACHTNFFAFEPVAAMNVDHNEIPNVDNCVSCHSSGGPAPGKPADHIPSTDNCGVCHATTRPFASIMASDVDHSPAGMPSIENCLVCHSYDEQPPGHQPNLPGTICIGCHSTDSW